MRKTTWAYFFGLSDSFGDPGCPLTTNPVTICAAGSSPSTGRLYQLAGFASGIGSITTRRRVSGLKVSNSIPPVSRAELNPSMEAGSKLPSNSAWRNAKKLSIASVHCCGAASVGKRSFIRVFSSRTATTEYRSEYRPACKPSTAQLSAHQTPLACAANGKAAAGALGLSNLRTAG